jgi:hypothetical protein
MHDEHHCPVDRSEVKDHNHTILRQAYSHASHGTQYALFNDECMATIKPNKSLLMQNIIESQSFMRKGKRGHLLILGLLVLLCCHSVHDYSHGADDDSAKLWKLVIYDLRLDLLRSRAVGFTIRELFSDR